MQGLNMKFQQLRLEERKLKHGVLMYRTSKTEFTLHLATWRLFWQTFMAVESE